MPAPVRFHRPRAPQLERETSLVPIAAARTVVEEASLWLGVTLPDRYATWLAHRARRVYVHCPTFRAGLRRPGDAGRDRLYLFLRHWLAARLYTERFDLYVRLPRDYAAGADLPPRPAPEPSPWLSPDARLLA